MEAKSERIREFINRLASNPSSDATEAFDKLLEEEDLCAWRSHLVDAADRQRAVHYETSFRHCDVERVLQTLDNREPANAADLSVLTLEYLKEIAQAICHGNTSDWRQYWNESPKKPKSEDLCRDAFLSDLRQKLSPLNIDAQPEGRYADDKRSDLRVSYSGFNVPIEIKKSSHRDLWRAIKTQLIPKYTRDPGSMGYGIYLVFWFGDTEAFRPTSGAGTPPQSATELEERLRDTLSVDEKTKISICVIDISGSEDRAASS